MVPPSKQSSLSVSALKKSNNKNAKKRKIGNDTSTTNNNSSNSRNGKQRLSIEEQHEVEKSERFSRLKYYASKLIKKEGKVVKAFECRKIAKKSSNQSNSNKNNNPQQILSLEDAKEFDLELLVQVCLKRLGINQQQLLQEEQVSKSNNNERQANDLELSFMEKILQHKKIVTVLETLAQRVTDYIEWDKQRQTWIHTKQSDNNDNHLPKKKKRKKNVNNKNDENDNNDISALFVDSLSGAAISEQEQNQEYDYNYGDEYFEDFDLPKKKNRKGQRARKAKALAIEAKKAGRVHDSSVNWRPKKANKKNNKKEDTSSNASGLRKNKPTKMADVAEMGKSWKEEGKAHPSWAAREAQKEKSGIGIVQFTGKKITFD